MGLCVGMGGIVGLPGGRWDRAVRGRMDGNGEVVVWVGVGLGIGFGLGRVCMWAVGGLWDGSVQ